MRDRGADWAPLTEWPEPRDLGGAALSRVRPARLTLLSGADVLQRDAIPQVGWPDVAQKGPHALRLRRDRLLVVDGPETPEGWDARTGSAATDMTAGLAVLEIEGQAALAILSRGAELSVRVPSHGVMRQVFGQQVALYRYGRPDRLRLLVERPLAHGLNAAIAMAARAGAGTEDSADLRRHGRTPPNA